MRQRVVMWVVLAGMLIGAGAIAVVASGGDETALKRLPALAIGGVGRDEAMSADSAAGSSMMAPYGYGAEYEVEGDLPKLDGEGPVYEVKGTASSSDVAKLAGALGIDAKVVEAPSAWLVASDAAHQLRVDKGPGHSWYFGEMAACGTPTTAIEPDRAVSSDGKMSMDYVDMPGCPSYEESIAEPPPPEECARDAAACDPATSGISGGGADGSAASAPNTGGPTPSATDLASEPVIDCKAAREAGDTATDGEFCTIEPVEPVRPADMPTNAEAERIARETLAKVGLDLDGATVRVEDGFSVWYVNVDPVVDGLPTLGWPWSVSVGPEGAIAGASGWLDDATHLDDYPLAGTDVGLERLRGGGGYGQPVPLAARDAIEPGIAIDCPPDAECAPPEKQVVTITGVKLGLQFAPVYTADGAPGPSLLIPTYLFETKGNDYPLPVIAVTDQYLPAQPEPATDLPVPNDTGTISGSSASCSGMGSEIGSDGSQPANQPLLLSVCTSADNPKVGEEVTFDLTMSDEDAQIVTGSCRGPEANFGDGGSFGDCEADCEAFGDVKPEPGKHAQQFTHTYAKAGTYTVQFRAWSGSACDGHPYGSFGESSVTVTVSE